MIGSRLKCSCRYLRVGGVPPPRPAYSLTKKVYSNYLAISMTSPILWPPDAKSQIIGKDLMLGKIERRRRRRRQRLRRLDGITKSQWTWTWANLREAWHAAVHGVTKSWTWLSNCTELLRVFRAPNPWTLFKIGTQAQSGKGRQISKTRQKLKCAKKRGIKVKE